MTDMYVAIFDQDEKFVDTFPILDGQDDNPVADAGYVTQAMIHAIDSGIVAPELLEAFKFEVIH